MTKVKRKICMLTLSALDNDTRILNEATALSQSFDLVILTSKYCSGLKSLTFKVKPVHKYPFFKVGDLFLLIKAAFREDPDIYHTHDLPGLLIGFGPALFKKKILVYDSHEIWSDMTLPGVWKALAWPFRFLEKILMFKVSQIITVNQSLAEYLAKRYHKPTLAIYNYPTLGKTVKVKTLKNSFSDKKLVVYLGAFRFGRGIKQVIESAKFLDDSYRILFIGYGPWQKKITNQIKKNHLEDKIKVLDKIAPGKIISVVRGCEVGLCLIEKVSLSYYLSSPNKLFQYIGAEVPVLGSNFPEFKRVILGNNIGEVVDVTKPKMIAQKISLMCQEVNQRKYQGKLKGLAKEKFSWKSEEKKLVQLYKKIQEKL